MTATARTHVSRFMGVPKDKQWTPPPVVPKHPATFSVPIQTELVDMLDAEIRRQAKDYPLNVLDPFAGVGTIHNLVDEAELPLVTFGLELQPEWAAAHPQTVCGSVLEVDRIFERPMFEVIATSPCYGNRMADSQDAQERCKACGGTGRMVSTACPRCEGTGRNTYERNTYTHKLRESGAEPVARDDNACVMQWGARYRTFHDQAWTACDQVLVPGGLVLLNIKNHVRTVRGVQAEQRVVEFHINTFFRLGYTLKETRSIPTRGLAHGQNHDVRTDAELVVALRKPEQP